MSNGYYYVAEVQDNFIATLINKLQFFSSLVPGFFSLQFLNTWESFFPIVWANVTPTLCREIVNWIYLTKSVHTYGGKEKCVSSWCVGGKSLTTLSYVLNI